jgi:transposase
MCGRVQSSPAPIIKAKSSTPKSPRRHRRLTKEQQKTLMADIQQGIASGDLNIRELSKKYDVSQNTVAYWKKKVDTQS